MSNDDPRAWLKPFLQPLKPIFREVLAMSAFVNLMALAIPVFTLQVYDRVIGQGGTTTLWGFLIGMVFVVIFDYTLRHYRSKIMQRVALRIDILVGRKLFDQLMRLPLSVLEGKPASYWQSLFRDVDTVRNTLSGASALLICDLPFVLMFLTLIWVIAAPIAWVLMIILPMFMLIAWRSAAAMSAANQDERQSTQSRDDLIAEMVNGRTTVKALALDSAMRPMWEERHADNIGNSMYRGARSDFYSNFGGSLTMMTTLFMTSAGAVAIMEGVLTMGSLIATNMLSGRLIGPMNQLVGQWRTYNSFKQSVERLGEVFNIEGERTESEVKLNRPNGEILVENVSYSYAEDLAPVVDQVSIKIKSGGVHALVGRNGSGKTTLLKMLQGLYPPTTGRILLDGADIAQFSRTELANWLGYVPQECVLFAGTVRDNIVHRRPDASDEEIVAAATAAGVHQFIIDLPDGYASEIGEAGRRLSGGQRQRIAIARALLGDPPVVLLDEPSSSLDRQAEQALRKTLVDIGRERTVVIVTHSPILLAACDDLVALDKGKVALAGPSKEILPKLFGQQPRQDGPPQAQPAPAPASLDKPSHPIPAAPKAAPPPQPRRPAPPPARPSTAARPPAPSARADNGPRPKPAIPAAPSPSTVRETPKRPTATARPPLPQPPTPKPAPPRPTQAKPAAPVPAAKRPTPPVPPTPPETQKSTPKPMGSGDKPKSSSSAKTEVKSDKEPPRPKIPPPPPQATADPSVPAGNRFSLDKSAGQELVEDPYADLIQSDRDKNADGETDRKQ